MRVVERRAKKIRQKAQNQSVKLKARFVGCVLESGRVNSKCHVLSVGVNSVLALFDLAYLKGYCSAVCITYGVGALDVGLGLIVLAVQAPLRRLRNAQSIVIRHQRGQSVHADGNVTDKLITCLEDEGIADLIRWAVAFNLFYGNY